MKNLSLIICRYFLIKMFFFLNLQTNIWILSFVIFGVYPPLLVNLDDLQIFLHVEVLFMLKLTNMTIIYIFGYFYNQFTFKLHVMTFYNYFVIEMVVLLWNYQKLLVFYFFGNDLPLVAKLIICHYFLIKLFFCLKITKRKKKINSYCVCN